MAKVKYDVSDVEVSERNYVQPKPGIYAAQIVEANPRLDNGKNDVEVVVEITEKGEFQKARLWSYVSFSEAARWKLRELTDAAGLPSKGTLDTDKLVGKKLKIKVNSGQYEGEYRARLQRFISPDEGGSDEDEGDEDDYSTWDLSDLEAEAEERGILGNLSGRKTKANLIKLLEADDEPEEEEDEEEEEADEDEEEDEVDEDEVDYDSMSLADLKAAAAEAGLEVKGPKSKYVAALKEHAASSESEDEESEEEDDYDEWEIDELMSEAKDRGIEIKGRKTKDKVIAALRADDGAPF